MGVDRVGRVLVDMCGIVESLGIRLIRLIARLLSWRWVLCLLMSASWFHRDFEVAVVGSDMLPTHLKSWCVALSGLGIFFCSYATNDVEVGGLDWRAS